jgi:hypothetical protein
MKTPLYHFTKKILSITHLRLVGHKAYGYVDTKGEKQAVQATECIMVGYSSSHKRYCLWEPTTSKILIS